MKKLLILVIALTLLGNLAMVGFAAEGSARMTDATVSDGETAYLTIRLEEGIVGDTIGIFYEYDEALLEMVPGESSWVKKSVLDDFSTTGNEGVWAAGKAADLGGDICVLAFRVRSGKSLSSTEVSCRVLVKKGSTVVGEYQTDARITSGCDHSFGDWEDGGTMGHTAVCQKCGSSRFQSHSWDGGVYSTDPAKPNVTIKTITCTACGTTKTEEVPSGQPGIAPVIPEETEYIPVQPTQERPQPSYPTEPTEPEPTRPTVPTMPREESSGSQTSAGSGNSRNPQPTQPTQEPLPQPKDYNQVEETRSPFAVPNIEGHDHEHDPEQIPVFTDAEGNYYEADPVTGEVRPMAIPITGETAAEHTHEHAEPEQVKNPLAVIVILAAAAAGVGAVVYLEKKKAKTKTK